METAINTPTTTKAISPSRNTCHKDWKAPGSTTQATHPGNKRLGIAFATDGDLNTATNRPLIII